MGTTLPTHILHNSPTHTVMTRGSGAVPENPEHPCLSRECLDPTLWPGSVWKLTRCPLLSGLLCFALGVRTKSLRGPKDSGWTWSQCLFFQVEASSPHSLDPGHVLTTGSTVSAVCKWPRCHLCSFASYSGQEAARKNISA